MQSNIFSTTFVSFIVGTLAYRPLIAISAQPKARSLY